MYRAKAIRDVLPLYSSSVDCAMDFLMKDMGKSVFIKLVYFLLNFKSTLS